MLGRDVALHVNGTLGQRGAYGNAVEFAGPYVDALGMDMRFTLANMGTELGAVTSYIQPDAKTLDWVRGRAQGPFTVYETDADFEYDATYEIDVSGIEPQIAVPHAPDNVKPVSRSGGARDRSGLSWLVCERAARGPRGRGGRPEGKESASGRALHRDAWIA